MGKVELKEKKEIINRVYYQLNRTYYQYVERKSRDYYNLFESQIVIKPEFEKESKMKERIGFYFFIMNNITRESDLLKLADNIVDTNFNEIFFPGLKAQDFGIDAYYINDKEEEPEIYLFNFKYRDEFGNGGQGENEIKLSKDFLDALKYNKKRSLKHKSLKMFNEIKSILDEKSSISIKLFFVSNDTHALNNTHVIESFKTSYDVDVIPIVLSDISEMTSLRHWIVSADPFGV